MAITSNTQSVEEGYEQLHYSMQSLLSKPVKQGNPATRKEVHDHGATVSPFQTYRGCNWMLNWMLRAWS